MKTTARRVNVLSFAFLALLAASPALAQAERGTMVQDDGQTRQVLHFSMPNFEQLRRPAYERRDLPVFIDILSLSEAQAARTGDELDAYLEAFGQLAARPLSEEELASAREGAGDGAPAGASPAGRGANNEWIDALIGEELEKAGIDPSAQSDFDMGISIGVGPPPDDPEGPPQADVTVSIGGDDLDDATKAKLQQVADAAATRIKDRIQKDLETGAFGMVGPGGDAGRDHMAERRLELELMRQRVREFKKQAEQLRLAFENNVKGILSDPQLEEWPVLERALVRMRTLPLGRLDGERTDLLRILDDLELSIADERAIAEHVESFEIQLHEALTRRNEGVDDADFTIDEALVEGDGRKAVREAEKASRLRTAVRDLNDTYIDIFAGALSKDAAAAFREEAQREGYPRAYEPSIAGRAFEQALAAAELTDETRRSIEELHAAYLVQVRSFNDAIHHAIRRSQSQELTAQIERVIALMDGREEDARPRSDDVEALERAEGRRRTFDRQTMSALYGVLPAEVVAALPKIPQRMPGDPVMVESTASSGGG